MRLTIGIGLACNISTGLSGDIFVSDKDMVGGLQCVDQLPDSAR